MFVTKGPRIADALSRFAKQLRSSIKTPRTIRRIKQPSNPPSADVKLDCCPKPVGSQYSLIKRLSDKQEREEVFLTSHKKFIGLMDQVPQAPGKVIVYSPNALFDPEVRKQIRKSMDSPDAHLALFETLESFFALSKSVAKASPLTSGKPVEELIVPADSIEPYRVLEDSHVTLDKDIETAGENGPLPPNVTPSP